jgi:hypothetical protein
LGIHSFKNIIMKKIILILLGISLTGYLTTSFAKVSSDGGGEGGPTIIKSKAAFAPVEKPCKTRGATTEISANTSGGSINVGGTQANKAYDCKTGTDITCQVIDCSGKTLVIMVSEAGD